MSYKKAYHFIGFWFILFLLLTIGRALSAHGQTPLANSGIPDAGPDTWGAIDALGRVLPDFRQVGPPKLDKHVGIFYFIWNNHPTAYLYDNDKIIKRRGYKKDWYIIGPMNTWHWWGEPLFGYYRSSDPWVLKEHAAMLGDAGVNTLILDSTNGPTYPDTQAALFRAFMDMQKLGTHVPKFACFCGHSAWNTVYRDIYAKGVAKQLWFYWGDKPLMLVNHKVSTLPAAIRKFFTLRRCWAAEFPYKRDLQPWFGSGKNKWTWIAYYPQPYGWHVSPQVPEEISVAAGGWAVSNMARDYHNGHLPPRRDQNPNLGLCFTEQWRHALKIDPAFIFVTSWNEWTAESWANTPPSEGQKVGRWKMVGHTTKALQPIYIDGFDEEYSRDTEPMKGGFGDDYYYQLVANIRRYKGVHPLPPIRRATIHIKGSFAQWRNLGPLFVNNVGLAVHRDYQGWGKRRYINNTGRNDIVAAKVCYNANNIYFWVRTRRKITSWKDPNWMLLFINTTGNPHIGWLGYNYVIDRKILNDHTTTLQKNVGGLYKWKSVSTVQFREQGDQMEMVVPRALLGLAHKLPKEINFKWADNIHQTGKWSDFYLNGDCAPPFRFYDRAKFR